MITDKILALPRSLKRLLVLLVDVALVPFAMWCAFSMRLGEFFVPQGRREDIIYLFFLAPAIAIPVFIKMGLYRAIIRYVGMVAMWTIVKAVTVYTLVFGLLILLSGFEGVPRSVFLINWLVVVLLIGCTRAIGRWWLRSRDRDSTRLSARRKVAIYGAGEAGVQIATALVGGNGFRPVAFIDDNRSLHGSTIEGLRVYSFKRLSRLIDDTAVTEVLLAMPSIPRSRRRQIISLLEPYPVHVITLPGMDDIASGKLRADDIREVDVYDLLGRESVAPDSNLLHANVRDKVVLVTGAGGSIGSELCRQLVKLGPTSLVLYEHSEHALYNIEKELLENLHRLPGERRIKITPILASIMNKGRLESVCQAFRVDTIYHAAAYKHVPMVEKNPSEAVRNNVLGTYLVAQAAIAAGTETFVLISTDKAVRPTSTMGATKRFAEMILQGLAASAHGKTRFTMVRFGNVLESSGSVVPLFREQIMKGGPITVTDPRIIRYFMTIPEAAQLVIQAGAMGQGGDVFVLDMGEPVRILDMARSMIHLSGFEVRDESNLEGDIEIVFTGLRPGEKLYEELLIGENVSPTQHPLIMSASEDCLTWKELAAYIAQFEETVNTHDVERNRALLMESIRGFVPQCDVVDLVEERRQQNDKVKKDNIIQYPG